MDILDSPLEALALNYVCFGFFAVMNNLWTWVAVITAAFSYWRIRAAAAGSSSETLEAGPPSAPVNLSSHGPTSPAAEQVPSNSKEDSPLPASDSQRSSSACAVDGDEVTKGNYKIVLYYEYDRESDAKCSVAGDWHGRIRAEDDGDDEEYRAVGEGCEGWERALRTKMGEFGWYRFQDTTALNGCVVRLWDGSRSRRKNGVSSFVLP